MATLVGGFGRVGDEAFLAGLHPVEGALTPAEGASPRVRIQNQARVDEVTMVFDQPTYPFLAVGFFVRRKGDNDVASGDIAFFLEAQQCRGDVGVLTLHVETAATIQPAILFRQGERRDGPVFRIRGDDVEMTQVEQGLAFALAFHPHDQAGLRGIAGIGLDDQVGGGKSRGQEPFTQRIDGGRSAFRIGGIDRQQLGQDFLGGRIASHRGCRLLRGARGCRDRSQHSNSKQIPGDLAHAALHVCRGREHDRNRLRTPPAGRRASVVGRLA